MGRYLLALVIAGCSAAPGSDLVIDRVDPASATNRTAVPLRVEGTGFRLPLTSDLDRGNTVVGDMAVRVGDVPLEAAVWRGEQLIEGSVPAGLAPGTYDVTVTLGDRSGVLVSGYVVENPRVRPPPGLCGGPGALADDFRDGQVAPPWNVDNPADVSEANGTLRVTPVSSTTTAAGYRSNPYVDMTNNAAEVEVQTVPTSGTGATAFFQLVSESERFGFAVSDGTLTMSVESATRDVPYDPIAHRIWRVEHASGMLVFQTSADGTAWTTHHTSPAPASVRAVTIQLGATNPRGDAAPGTATFAEMSTYVAPSTWCAARTLSDGFTDATIGLEWAYHGRSNSGCAETEGGGLARVDQNGTQACDAFYASSALYTLEASEIVARITAIGTFTSGWITYLGVSDLGGRSLRLYFEQNMMCVDGTGISEMCGTYSTAEDLWRIREDGGTVYFEMSVGGATWRLVRSVPVPFPLTAIRPRFGTRTDRAIGQSIGLGVDRIN